MNYDIRDEALADDGQRRIDWAARRMPVLAALRARYEETKPFEGQRFGACMHVTTETANLMLALQAGGGEVTLSASNPLSTQDDVAAALVRAGVSVHAVRGEDTDTYYRHLQAVLDTEPTITMDDGADLVTLLHTERTDVDPVGSMEETTTGVIRLRAMEADGTLRFPVVAVNDSDTKHLFDNRHGTGQSALDGLLRATNILVAGKTVVVIGYGDCGRGVAQRADGLGAKVVVVEVDPVRALEAAMEGYQVTTVAEAARVGEVFVTVTGNIHVLRDEHFAVMQDGAILGNAGHFDVEIDLIALDKMASANREIRQNLDEFELPDGRRILVIAQGRLMNLAAAEGHPADVMDMSFANQALAAEWILQNTDELESKVYRLPPEIDHEVAALKLKAVGGELETLTEEQEDYLASWKLGT